MYRFYTRIAHLPPRQCFLFGLLAEKKLHEIWARDRLISPLKSVTNSLSPPLFSFCLCFRFLSLSLSLLSDATHQEVGGCVCECGIEFKNVYDRFNILKIILKLDHGSKKSTLCAYKLAEYKTLATLPLDIILRQQKAVISYYSFGSILYESPPPPPSPGFPSLLLLLQLSEILGNVSRRPSEGRTIFK